jgi:hypothetical protein
MPEEFRNRRLDGNNLKISLEFYFRETPKRFDVSLFNNCGSKMSKADF